LAFRPHPAPRTPQPTAHSPRNSGTYVRLDSFFGRVCGGAATVTRETESRLQSAGGQGCLCSSPLTRNYQSLPGRRLLRPRLPAARGEFAAPTLLAGDVRRCCGGPRDRYGMPNGCELCRRECEWRGLAGRSVEGRRGGRRGARSKTESKLIKCLVCACRAATRIDLISHPLTRMKLGHHHHHHHHHHIHTLVPRLTTSRVLKVARWWRGERWRESIRLGVARAIAIIASNKIRRTSAFAATPQP
jgi:hypothetical protein